MLFSLKLQRDNRQNALAVDPAKRKTGEKSCIFHRTVKMNQPHTITEPKRKHQSFLMTRPLMKALSAYMVVLFLQYDKNIDFFPVSR